MSAARRSRAQRDSAVLPLQAMSRFAYRQALAYARQLELDMRDPRRISRTISARYCSRRPKTISPLPGGFAEDQT